MKYYIVRITIDGEYEKSPAIYFTKEAAQKSCDWNNKMYKGFWKVVEVENESDK